MRSYMNLAVLALAVSTVSTALSAPIQYRCGNLLVESNGRAFLISAISLGSLGWILISFVVSNSLVSVDPLRPTPILLVYLKNLSDTPTPRNHLSQTLSLPNLPHTTPSIPNHFPHTPRMTHYRPHPLMTNIEATWLSAPLLAWALAPEWPEWPDITL